MRRTIQGISVDAIQRIAYALARQTMSWNEPIPDFETRFPNVLESCILVPFQTYEHTPLYSGLIGKAAILFYLLIKDHPFQNGNKRIAVTTLLVFLRLNGKWLEADEKDLYRFAVWVAESQPDLKDDVVSAIQTFVRRNMVDRDVKSK